MYSVAIVSPEKSLEPIEKVIQDKSFECHFYPYIYTHLSDIDKIYEDCRKKCDVIFFSGELVLLRRMSQSMFYRFFCNFRLNTRIFP